MRLRSGFVPPTKDRRSRPPFCGPPPSREAEAPGFEVVPRACSEGPRPGESLELAFAPPGELPLESGPFVECWPAF